MEILNITEKRFRNLKQWGVGTEGMLYRIGVKELWVTEQKLLKKLFWNEGRNFANKLLVVSTLIDNKEVIGCDQLVLPEKLATVDKKVVGFILPFIKGSTLKNTLNQMRISEVDKIKILKKLGDFLECMQNIRKYKMDGLFLGDLHEENIIVTDEGKDIKVVDLDSAKVADSHPLPSKYLSTNKELLSIPEKYVVSDTHDLIIPNENTDIFCYNTIVLNYLAGINTSSISIVMFYEYLNYLLSVGADKGLVDAFASVYDNGKNISCSDYLETIPESKGKMLYKVFEYNYNKQKQ